MKALRIGDRICPSEEGLKSFNNWQGRTGTIIGKAADDNIWEVRWDGGSRADLVHADFIDFRDENFNGSRNK